MCQIVTRVSKLIFFVVFLTSGYCLVAQQTKTKAQLEQEKKENLRKIAEAEKILSETESERKVTIGQLTAINEQVKARESLIVALNQEVALLNGEIGELNIVVRALQRDLTNLKKEYASMIYSSYKANRGFSTLTFLFSSQTFNQLFKRLKYLEQYSESRKIQASQIEQVSRALNLQRTDVEGKIKEQQKLLAQQINENKKLVSLKDRKSSLVAELNKREKEIRSEMGERKKSIEQLDKLIAELIRREIEKSRTLSTVNEADENALTGLFEQTKGKMAWPVSTGFISMKFGMQPHPVLKNIEIENTGIEIQTNQGETVKSVFIGEVKTLAFVPGHYNVVVVKHGSYYTVYSRLKEVNVKKGQKVNASDVIGKVHTSGEGVSELHFEVWKNTEKLDPEKWLTK
ncbi:MAG: peptidoglycan DD-metalloendopeptidase family protein [Cyclobacteriaceae bacterium]|nr:peptidoglycan DD-metalloendopeptidase family protein [Cyclobacteriaceae bacterium]